MPLMSHGVIRSIGFLTACKAAIEVLLLQPKLLVLMEVGTSIKHFVCLVQSASDHPSTSLQPTNCSHRIHYQSCPHSKQCIHKLAVHGKSFPACATQVCRAC